MAPAQHDALAFHGQLQQDRVLVGGQHVAQRGVGQALVGQPGLPGHPLALAVVEHQQRFIGQCGRGQRAAVQVARRAYREHFLAIQPSRGQSGRRTLAQVVHADIELCRRQRRQAVVDGQAQLDLGVRLAERGQPRRQPQHRHAAGARHRQGGMAAHLHHVFGRFGTAHQQALHHLGIALAADSQAQRARLADKELAPEKAFQLGYLAADRALRQVQFRRGAGEAAVAHRGFKRDQVGQGRERGNTHGGFRSEKPHDRPTAPPDGGQREGRATRSKRVAAGRISRRGGG
ncbi:hypothetical protein AU476_17695 [Cupriavidus sp. UYMSc13B]|nr:hypothetical protein AU476_17695 [Cupriavidus sp. UYMSc13B]